MLRRSALGAGLQSAFATTVAVVVLATTGTAQAQIGRGALTGKVLDGDTGRPVSDVVVTMTSPAVQGEQLAITDATGTYRIPDLPAGEYTLSLTREGYRPLARTGLTLRADVTLRFDVSLLPETLTAATIEVSGTPPTVDVASSSIVTDIGHDVASRLPLGSGNAKGGGLRSIENAAELAPGAAFDRYGTSIAGTTSPENSYLIDGLSVGNPAFGLLGTPLSMEFVQQLNVITGGYMPEYGKATGGIINAVVKSGSNEFHGSAWSYVSPFEGARRSLHSDGSAVGTQRSLDWVADYGADVGGPIVRDKLWFYAGVLYTTSRYRLDRYLQRRLVDDQGAVTRDADGFERTEELPGTRQRFYAESRRLQAVGKLTFAASSRDRLELTTIVSPHWSGGGGAYSIDPKTGEPETYWLPNLTGSYSALAHRQRADAYDAIVKWSHDFGDKKLLLDTTVGYHHETAGQLAADGSRPGDRVGYAGMPQVQFFRNTPSPWSITDFERLPDPSLCAPVGAGGSTRCPVSSYYLGGPDFLDEIRMDRYQMRSVLTYFGQWLGHHVVKGGLDAEYTRYDHIKAYSGGTRMVEVPDGSLFVDQRQFGWMSGPDEANMPASLRFKTSSVSVGGFLQDGWNIADRVTLNLGLRYDAQALYDAQGKLGMALPNQIAPRVGMVWDPFGRGRSRVFASYAIYYESVPLNVADRALSGDPNVLSVRLAESCNRQDPSQLSSACLQEDSRLVINGATSADRKWIVTGAGPTAVDPNLMAQSTSEVVAGAEIQPMAASRAGFAFTHRWLNNVIEDMSRDNAQTFFIGNPGRGVAGDFPKPRRDYDALTLYFNKTFSDAWFAQISYTLSALRGNYSGLYRAETNQLDPNYTSEYDLATLMANREGPLPGDSTHSFRLLGARDIALPGNTSLNVGAAVRARSGGPTNVLGAHQLYGLDEVFILPRGSGERLPWNGSVDLHLGYAIRMTGTRTVTMTFDAFNLFNFQAPVAVDQRYTSQQVQPIINGTTNDLANLQRRGGEAFQPETDRNPSFGKPIAYQPPLTLRFGLRGSF